MRNAVRFAAIFAATFAMHLSTAQAASERVVYSFCSQAKCADGAQPASNLIDVNGTLYGTTEWGGSAGSGTVFSIDPNTGAETVVHSFTGEPDGGAPVAPVVNVGGTLYGTTSRGGGPKGFGTVFSIDPNTGVETVLHSFKGKEDGANPMAGLIAVKDKLYGTTHEGGTGACPYTGCGTVFAISLKTGRETVLYSFCSQTNCTDGGFPLAPLLDVGGTLYGTTSLGGTGTCYGEDICGTVFSLDTATGVETALHSFQGYPDGFEPDAGLANLKGTLYGTTYGGGKYNRGTIFSINPTTGVESVLKSLSGSSAANLTRVGSTLYGTTLTRVFSFTPATGTYNLLHHFCRTCGDGASALASVIAVNGTLYGTTSHGGANTACRRGCGTVFAVQLQ